MTGLEAGMRELIAGLVREEVARQLAQATKVDEFLSTGAAAAFVDVAPGTIRRWIREGKLAEHRAGRVVRVRRSDLERLLSAPCRTQTLSPEERARRDFG